MKQDISLSDDHEVTIGLVYEKTELDDVEKFGNVGLRGFGEVFLFPARDLTDAYIAGNAERTTKALYLQDSWQISPRFNLTGGLRLGDHSDFGDANNPRLGLVYRFSETLYSKVLYGEAFKPPAFTQLFDRTPTLSPFRFRGNLELRPTEIRTTELQLGYDFSPPFNVTVSLFDNRTDNEIFFDSTPGVERWANSGARASPGLELNIRSRFTRESYAFFNYSYQDTSGVDRGIAADIHPETRLNLGGHYPFYTYWGLNLAVSYFRGIGQGS